MRYIVILDIQKRDARPAARAGPWHPLSLVFRRRTPPLSADLSTTPSTTPLTSHPPHQPTNPDPPAPLGVVLPAVPGGAGRPARDPAGDQEDGYSIGQDDAVLLQADHRGGGAGVQRRRRRRRRRGQGSGGGGGGGS